ncbi:hypothetical protein C8F04DRAFT_1174684 [Mycena alexandri]|uniref:Uncharacterized protein n=1 Tax=Mycena alexandri TaxID=1745969 RepID=A0AAD6X9L1_9AGAR|nr:hypothetical protein C8F04DRAFT_1174684 [Mycena alexandri]
MRRHRSRLSFAEVLCSVSVGGGSLSLLNSSRRVSLSAVAASNDKIDISNEGTNDMKSIRNISVTITRVVGPDIRRAVIRHCQIPGGALQSWQLQKTFNRCPKRTKLNSPFRNSDRCGHAPVCMLLLVASYEQISDVDAAGMQKEEGRAPAMRSGARTVSVPKDFAGFREFLAVARPMKSWRAMLALRQWVDRKAAGGGALLPSLRSERESSSAIHCGYLSTPEDLE